MCLVSIHVVHPYSSINTTTAWEKLHYILSDMSDFHMTDSLSIAVHAFASYMLMSFLVDETLLSRKENLSTNFRGPPFSVNWFEFRVFLLLDWLPRLKTSVCPTYSWGENNHMNQKWNSLIQDLNSYSQFYFLLW